MGLTTVLRLGELHLGVVVGVVGYQVEHESVDVQRIRDSVLLTSLQRVGDVRTLIAHRDRILLEVGVKVSSGRNDTQVDGERVPLELYAALGGGVLLRNVVVDRNHNAIVGLVNTLHGDVVHLRDDVLLHHVGALVLCVALIDADGVSSGTIDSVPRNGLRLLVRAGLDGNGRGIGVRHLETRIRTVERLVVKTILCT